MSILISANFFFEVVQNECLKKKKLDPWRKPPQNISLRTKSQPQGQEKATNPSY